MLNKYDTSESNIQLILSEEEAKLREARKKRIHPETDRKILTSWNALMITALADAWHASGKEEYLNIALETAAFLKENLVNPEGGLIRSFDNSIPAFLDDYAFSAEAFLKLYEAVFKDEYLHFAKQLADYSIRHFFDQQTGMFFYNSDTSLNPVARQSEVSDSVIPSSNSALSFLFYKLSVFFDNPFYKSVSDQMLQNVLPVMQKSPAFFSNWARRLLMEEQKSTELVISGKDLHHKRRELCGNFLPFVIIAGSEESSESPLLKEKFRKGETLLYVCRNKSCLPPVQDTELALQQISQP